MKQTPLQRAMLAETILYDYCEYKESLIKDERAVTDLITDLCHLLHLDEKTAGCKSPEDIHQILTSAFDRFLIETAEKELVDKIKRRIGIAP
jgi:hypothetical protein